MTDTAQPSGAAETGVSREDAILAAAQAFKGNTPEERARNERGQFVSTREPEPAPEIEAEDDAEPIGEAEPEAESHDEEYADEAADEAQPDAVELPTSWPSEHAETWKSLPPETQAIIAEREGQRDAAVNAKFQEAANLRKAHEAEISEAQTNRQAFREAADFLMSVVRPQRPPASMLDPNSSDYNPDAYHLANRKADEQEGLLRAVAQQRNDIAQQEAAEAEKARQQRIAEINSKALPELVKLVPEFSDPAKADPAFMGLAQYALAQGVPEETELSAFTAVELTLLAKARKYDEMMAAKAKVQPKAPKPSAPVVKPGVATSRGAIEQQRRKQVTERLAREGSVEAGAAFFKSLKF